MGKLLLLAGLAVAWSVTSAHGQSLDEKSRAALDKRDWRAAAAAIREATANKPTGESAVWLAVALGELGETVAVTRIIEPIWDAGPVDRALTYVILRYSTVGWLRSFNNEEFHHAVFDDELARQLVRARARCVRDLLANDPPTTDGAMLEADRLIDAFERLRILTDDPGAEMERLAGFALAARDRWAEAVPLLVSALERGDETWDAWLDLATAQCGSGDMEAARASFARARELAPPQDSNSRGGVSRRSTCGLAWAKALVKRGYYREAIDAYKVIIKEQPAAEGVRHMLGEAAYRIGDLGLAVWAYTDSLALDGVAESAAGLARCWMDMGDTKIARACIERAVSMMNASERKVPAEVSLLHGQILWEAGDKPEALKHYEAAYKADPRNIDVARAAYQAFLAADDVYGALDVCRSVGNNADVPTAVEGVQEILRRWPTPRMADMARKKPMSHVGTAQFLLADLCWWSGKPREGVEYLRMARGLTQPRTAANASWMLFAAGDLKNAARAASEAIESYKADPYWSDHNRVALATIRAHEGKWEDAVKALEGVKAEAAVRRAGVIRYYAALQSGTLKDKPDLFHALGIVDAALRGDGWGIEILSLLPGSPLLNASPPLRWRDRVYHIEGFGYVGSNETLKKLRPATLPAGTVVVRFLRDGERFESVMTTGTLPAPAAAPPAGASKGGGK